ncbi:MAG: hypothetical protein JNM24_08645 [Bdellovibrionaceae bacterium]|nr:hypothetical protein [Pseudobdellovibrionaceae bacterium]
MKTRWYLIGVLLVLNPFGCTDRVETVPAFAPPNSEKISDAPVGQSVDVRSAMTEECQNGGIVYTVYIDVNLSSSFDEEDSVIKKYAVCNGANGSDGSNGSDGKDGKDGNGVAFAVVNASVEQCPSGGSTILMATDVGNTGLYDVNADNQQSMTICNGQNAVTPAYTPVEVIYACGNNVAYKEVLLRLNNGQVLASVSDNTSGKMTRLAFLTDGNFVNTDNSGCNFSLSTSSDGKTRSISWSGSVQKSWSISY